MADVTPADPKQPAYDAVFAYIRSQPDVLPATVVERNAMIWRAVHAALKATPPAPLAEREQAMLGFALEMADEEIHARCLEIPDEERAALTSLRRFVGDAAARVQQTTTNEGEKGGCWCGHREDRHFTSQAMTLPNGCHDCQGWDGAHAYGQELPWAVAPAAPEASS